MCDSGTVWTKAQSGALAATVRSCRTGHTAMQAGTHCSLGGCAACVPTSAAPPLDTPLPQWCTGQHVSWGVPQQMAADAGWVCKPLPNKASGSKVPSITWTPQHTPTTGHTCMHTHPQQCTGHGPQQGQRGMAPVMAHLQGQRGLSWAGGRNGRGGVSLRLGSNVCNNATGGAGPPSAQGGKGSAGW